MGVEGLEPPNPKGSELQSPAIAAMRYPLFNLTNISKNPTNIQQKTQIDIIIPNLFCSWYSEKVQRRIES